MWPGFPLLSTKINEHCSAATQSQLKVNASFHTSTPAIVEASWHEIQGQIAEQRGQLEASEREALILASSIQFWAPSSAGRSGPQACNTIIPSKKLVNR